MTRLRFKSFIDSPDEFTAMVEGLRALDLKDGWDLKRAAGRIFDRDVYFVTLEMHGHHAITLCERLQIVRLHFFFPEIMNEETVDISLEETVADEICVTYDPHLAERMVNWLQWWIPRKFREDALMDIREDISRMRAAGLSEKQNLSRAIWQLSLLMGSRLTVWRWAIWGYLLLKARELFRLS